MSVPKNPNQIILKNKYYPSGITEDDVWNYYQQYKGSILTTVRNRVIMFAIMTDVNKPVLRRKLKDGKLIRLTNSNYDDIITGRTIAIYSTMNSYEDILIVDIDVNNFTKAKEAALQVNHIVKKFPNAVSTSIRFTGKTAFHIECKLNRKYPIDRSRMAMNQYLMNSQIQNLGYTVAHKRSPGIPNIDLSPNKMNGAFITPNSLSIIGLRCLPLKESELATFTKTRAKLK